MDKLLAVWCVELSSEGTLVGLGHTGAVKSVRPKTKQNESLNALNFTGLKLF